MLGRMTRRIHPDAGTTHYAYDNAGNLLEEINPLGQINYDYTYYRLLKKRYYMTFSRLGIVQTLRDLPSAFGLTKTFVFYCHPSRFIPVYYYENCKSCYSVGLDC
jgi:YD repeat-containing protein